MHKGYYIPYRFGSTHELCSTADDIIHNTLMMQYLYECMRAGGGSGI